ncbi:MAG: SUMF1/EgtB/PvdO family nonheme iron enzyme, partial [Bacteroidales bacterium]|nr:SUMF1/EgtB/PvdO family nonheme iron enzyme [Bacteroidales bacterium]
DNLLGGHAITIVGYSDDMVYVNDPSGALFEEYYKDVNDNNKKRFHNLPISWDDYFDKTDTSLDNDGFFVRAEGVFEDFSTDYVSFDLCPSYFNFLESPYFSLSNPYSMVSKSGIESDPLIFSRIKLDWDNFNSWVGYHYFSNSRRVEVDDNNFDSYFVYHDIITINPFITCYSNNDKKIYFKIAISNAETEVYRTQSSDFKIYANSHEYNRTIIEIPVKDFYNKLTTKNCKITLVCYESESNIEQDGIVMEFVVGINPSTVNIQSNPAGVNVMISHSDQSEQKDGTTPFSRIYYSNASISLNAPATHSGWRFTEWQKNGQTYSINSNIQIQVDDDATYKAVYQVLDSELYVSGSSAPEVFALSGRPSQGWNNIRIPVYNRKFTTVNVNVTKSGNAANWVKLIDGASFQLSGNEMKIYLISISIPSSADPGIYSAHVSFNGIAQEFYITVSESTAEIIFPFRNPSGNINGDWTWDKKTFSKNFYDYWFEIMGNNSGPFVYPYFHLTPEEVINIDWFRLGFSCIKEAAINTQNLDFRLNRKTMYTVKSSAWSQGNQVSGNIDSSSWHYLSDNSDGLYNIFSFEVNPSSSTDTTVRWKVFNPTDWGLLYCRTTSAWQSEEFDIPSSQWNDIKDDFLGYAQILADVDSVERAGYLKLFVNGKQPDTSRVKSTSTEISWDVSPSHLMEDDNIFTIKAETTGSNTAPTDESGTGTIASLSNIRLYMRFNTEIPNLELTKSISPNPVLVGQEATVKITISNPTEYSSTGDSTSLIDAALPAGLVRTSGSLSDSSFAEKLEEGDSEEHSYRIKADVPGYYTLGSASFTWDNFEGDEMEMQSSPVVLEVRGGGLVIAPGFEESSVGDDLVIDYSATVTSSLKGEKIENAVVTGNIYRQEGDAWLRFGEPVTLAYDPLTGDFSGTSRIIDRRGNYKAVLTAQCQFYDDGISTPYFFIPDLPLWRTTQITKDGVTTVMIISYSGDGGAIDIPAQINGYSVTSIGDSAFSYTSGVTSVTIPDSVTSIGRDVFDGCDELTGIYFAGSPPELEGEYFGAVNADVFYIFGTVGWGSTFGGLPVSVWCTTATFDGNGGTPSYETRKYNVGKAYGELPTANLSGYLFEGWWTLDDGGYPVSESTLVPLITTTHTLYAKWAIISTVATPTFNPNGGAHTGTSVNVTVSCSTAGATIHYTINGSEPTESDQTVASGNIVQVPVPGTLKAKAWKAGMNASDTKTAGYTEKPKSLVFWEGNLHYYELVEVPEGLTWDQAKIAAETATLNGIPGYLATINSAEENSFIVEYYQNVIQGSAWIGGDQESGKAADQGWRWVTGEPWTYTNWRIYNPEPNDCYGSYPEDALEIMFNLNDATAHGYWNDAARHDQNGHYYYLVEYPSMYCRRTAGGTLNGQPVDKHNNTVEVTAGDLLQGSFNVAVNNTMHGGAVAPLAATVTWGNRTTQYWTVKRSISTGVNTYTIPVDCMTPDTPGDYYLIVGFSGMYNGAQVLSSTTAGRAAVWNDGNDVGFDWTESQFSSALGNNGIVWVNMLQMDNNFPIDAQPFTAIKIHVTKPLSAEYPLTKGWNLISINLNLTEKSQQLLQTKKATTLSPTGDAYVFSSHLTPPQACWIYCQSDETITLTGTSPENFDFVANLKKGWNFVGPITDCLLSDNGTIAWGWNGQHQYPTKSILSGSGYYLYWPEDQAEIIPRLDDYLVIDLSLGPDATSYPVSTFAAVPPGGWTDEYKTTKLVLRKIPAGAFVMGSPENELGRESDETQHQVTLTKDFYVGVFEVTQKQWERVMGNWPSYFTNASCRDSRPVEKVSYEDIRGSDTGSGWPANNDVDAGSFMGRLRARTGLDFDLPTEAQWEYACRAGTTTALNSGKNLTGTGSCSNMAEVGRYYYNGGSDYSSGGDTLRGTAKVGSYLPNQWGLYDMHGNVWEWCLDWSQSDLGSSPQIDPQGAAGGSYRVYRGGRWNGYAYYCRSADRRWDWPSYRLINRG